MQHYEPTQPHQCDVCKVPYFERNNYFHGKLLSPRDLKAEQDYFNEKRWLINRMILGWGIVCGLEVTWENSCLFITPGMALDCCGHELLVCERQSLHSNKIAEAVGGRDPYASSDPVRWALCLEYHECKSESVRISNSCDNERGEYNRIRDHYRLVIKPFDEACPADQNDDNCPFPGLDQGKSIHEALVEKSGECPKCRECQCVLLATGTVEMNGQEPRIVLDRDYWKYRRLVYTNQRLAGLINCLHKDLAHITEINWNPNGRYDTAEFLDLLTRKHLEITFDRPLRHHTVTDPRSFRLSIYVPLDDGSCPVHLLIPVERIEYYDNKAVYYFDHDCIEHQLRRECNRLKKPAEVELILHGSMVLDKKGRALDAELIEKLPTGNGVEGGEFITYFTVGP